MHAKKVCLPWLCESSFDGNTAAYTLIIIDYYFLIIVESLLTHGSDFLDPEKSTFSSRPRESEWKNKSFANQLAASQQTQSTLRQFLLAFQLYQRCRYFAGIFNKENQKHGLVASAHYRCICVFFVRPILLEKEGTPSRSRPPSGVGEYSADGFLQTTRYLRRNEQEI